MSVRFTPVAQNKMSNSKYKPSEQRRLQDQIELPDPWQDMNADYCYDDFFDTSDDYFYQMSKEESEAEVIKRLLAQITDLGYKDNPEDLLIRLISQ